MVWSQLRVEKINTLKTLIQNDDIDSLREYSDHDLQYAIDYYSGYTLMHVAASEGKLEIMKMLHNKGLMLDDVSKSDLYPIHCAASLGNVEILNFILTQNGSLINVVSDNGYTPLHWAASTRSINAMIFLVKQGANLSAESTYYGTPFGILKGEYYSDLEYNENMTKEEAVNILEGLLAAENSPEKPQETLEEGVDPSASTYVLVEPTQQGAAITFQYLKSLIKDNNLTELKQFDAKILQQARNSSNGETLMHTAAHISNLEMVQFLYNQGLRFDANSVSDLYPLHYATLKCDIPVLKFILTTAPNLVNVMSEDLDTPLHCLARSDHIQGMIYLIQNGGDMNIQNMYDGTPFDILRDEYYHDLEYDENMTQKKAINILESLLAAESDQKKQKDMLEEIVSLEDKTFQCIRDLVINDPNVIYRALQNAKDIGSCALLDIKSGITISHIAAGYGRLELLTLIWHKGVNINTLSKDGYHPLHYVVLYNAHWNAVTQSIVSFFVQHNKKLIDVQKIDGYTPLHIAADNNNIEFVIELIKLGANSTIQDYNGFTPFDILKNQHPDLEYDDNMTPEEIVNILESLLADASSDSLDADAQIAGVNSCFV